MWYIKLTSKIGTIVDKTLFLWLVLNYYVLIVVCIQKLIILIGLNRNNQSGKTLYVKYLSLSKTKTVCKISTISQQASRLRCPISLPDPNKIALFFTLNYLSVAQILFCIIIIIAPVKSLPHSEWPPAVTLTRSLHVNTRKDYRE